MLGIGELLILILIGLIIFGNKNKLPEIARSLGKFSSEYKKGKDNVQKEIDNIKKELK